MTSIALPHWPPSVLMSAQPHSSQFIREAQVSAQLGSTSDGQRYGLAMVAGLLGIFMAQADKIMRPSFWDPQKDSDEKWCFLF